MRIPRSSTYAQFLKKIYQKIGVDSNEYLLKVSAKHSCQYLGRIKETLFPITNDDSLSFLLDPEAEIPMLEVYVDAEQIHVEPPPTDEPTMGEINPQMSQQWGEANPQMSNQWGEYMNLLATPGLPPCSNTDYLAGTSNPDFGAGTSNLDFGAGTSLFKSSVQKAWYSLKMAREIVYGTWESSVQKLPAYLGAIQKYNPGTIVEWKHKGFQASTGKYVMGYVFWAFKPCIDGFQFCRNVIV
ncbi:UNVERIFIED_CONTAM: hypothetical protein Scaly_2658100 [Sesamum calycinum]|uniref:Uncharacterized protein n=1 Tax=Sesamum calycinum TaxID=2727403 RepID=A0AAW2JB68_9LAMI